MFVVGTAGHVDHGKSTLVKSLTGIDPDRWEEEQRREMTIDLGFAWLTLPNGQAVSLIDVPGHERFVKNMLAGVGGIDAVLLIIAADESVMPQTAEHLAILDLLGISHGVVVISKADLVDPEWLALVQEDVHARLASTSLANLPIVPVSARTGSGLATLLATLEQVLAQIPSRSERRDTPRLPIDRAFTIGGFGAVVTGTLLDGPLRVGDEVEILPRGLRARVRGLQNHQQRVDQILPGTRAAVNLANLSHRDLARGDLLAFPGRIQPTDLIDAQIRLTADARPIEQNERFDLFVGACEVPCRITLLNDQILTPGAEGWVQLRLERPIACVRGDRYILRQASPSRTLAGGRIIDTKPARHRRFRPEVVAMLAALARGTPADLLRPLIASNLPVARAELVQQSNLSPELVQEGIATLLAEESLLQLGTSHVISAGGWPLLREKIHQGLAGYHRRYPLRMGMPREELRSRLKLSADALEACLLALPDLVRLFESSVALLAHQPSLTASQQRDLAAFLAACRQQPFMPPVPDLEPELLALQIEQRHLIRVADDVVFLPESYQVMADWVEQQLNDVGSLTVAQFRDRFATSRKYALAVLEYLDERRLTRRSGDVRVRY
ncbi:MAG: selenocysteine-specific translation elongation factor [Roseiflexaceae bacterium]